jgi:glyoxylase-like metal-dependent hydrolase (beta-lactamase superfamily II)
MRLRFNRDFDARHGEAVEMAPGIRRITARNPGPFTFHGTNTFLIGEDDVAVLDPGPDDSAHIKALLGAIGSATVTHILVSHTHLDHSPGARLLKQQTGAPILAAGPHKAARPLQPGESARVEQGADLAFAPDRTLTEGEIIEVGDVRLEVVATPGHTANHLAFAVVRRNMLFSGDHVMGWSTTLVAPPDGSMADYMRSLDKLAGRAERRYLPAHGGAIDDAPVYVRALKAHRLMRERAILQRLRQGDRTIAEIVPHIYADTDLHLHAAAALTTLAHLEDLVERGRVAADSAPSLKARYSPARPL